MGFESLLASSHMSALSVRSTPQFATVKMSDSVRMQREYEEYLKQKEQLCGSLLARKLTPSRVQERMDSMASTPQQMSREMEEGSGSDEEEEYDSEGIDSIKLRL